MADEAHIDQGQILQLLDKAVINNYFLAPNRSPSPMVWISAVLSGVSESSHIYSASLDLLYANNRFGTLSGSPPGVKTNIYTVFRYLRRFYSNTDDAVQTVIKSLRTNRPLSCVLNMVGDQRLYLACRAIPVSNNGRIYGVVLLAEKRERYGRRVSGPSRPILPIRARRKNGI